MGSRAVRTVAGAIRLGGLFSVLALVPALGAAQRRLGPGYVPQAINRLQPISRLAAERRLPLAIGLPLRNRDALTNFLRELYDPASTNYHRYLSPREFTVRFGPTQQDYQSVIAFARAHHFTITAQHPNRMILDVSAPASDIDRAFQITLRRYRHPTQKRDFFAPDTRPTVPAAVPILDVSGLSDYHLPRPRLRRRPPSYQAAQAMPRSGSSPSGSYMGKDFRAAYVPGVTLTGAGQAVGLVQFDGFYSNDIVRYEDRAGLPHVPIETVLLDGYNGVPTSSGNGEVALDIEMAIAMAPGLDKVIVYSAGPTGLPNDVLNKMVLDNQARQLSCSWGWDGGPSSTTDQIFQQMAAQGQSFFCASGDEDAYPPGAVDDASQQNAPSDSPYITIVGGTTLTTAGPGGAWVSESVWNWGGGTGSGGGVSSYYPMPAWQQGINMNVNGGSTIWRNIPDVALTADNVYVTDNNGGSETLGGTSCAAPLWAGFTALLNERAANDGLPPVGFLNPALYALGKGSDYTNVFHDITVGNNKSRRSPNQFDAVPGYDLCTGWGTPKGMNLIQALVAQPDPLSISPSADMHAAGLVGGPFGSGAQEFSLSNTGSGTLNWSVSHTSAWLDVSPAGGTISAGAPPALVTASVNTAADDLSAGSYTATVWFTNLDTGFVQQRRFVLEVSLELVRNGGFETGDFTGWTQSGNTNYTSVTSSASYVHSGGFGVQLGPADSPGYLSQTLPTLAGRPYYISLWLSNPKAGNPNEFRVAWGGTTLFDQSDIPQEGWTNLRFIVTAPSDGTELQLGFQDQPAYLGLDDVSAWPVEIPTLRQLIRTNHTVAFSWNTLPGLTYQVQYTTNLAQANWINLGSPVTATKSYSSLSDPGATDSQRFYRILVVP